MNPLACSILNKVRKDARSNKYIILPPWGVLGLKKYNNIDGYFDLALIFQNFFHVDFFNVILESGGVARKHASSSRNKDVCVKSLTDINRRILNKSKTFMALKTISDVPRLSIPSTIGLKSSSVASKRSLRYLKNLPTLMTLPSGSFCVFSKQQV